MTAADQKPPVVVVVVDAPPWPPLSASRGAPHSFGYHTVKHRLPVIVSQTVDALVRHVHAVSDAGSGGRVDGSGEIMARLSRLRYELQCNKPLRLSGGGGGDSNGQGDPSGDKDEDAPLPGDDAALMARDLAQWQAALARLRSNTPKETAQRQPDAVLTAGDDSQGDRWFDAPWLLIECLLYRRIAEAFAHAGWWFRDYDWFGERKRASFWSSADVGVRCWMWSEWCALHGYICGLHAIDESFLTLFLIIIMYAGCLGRVETADCVPAAARRRRTPGRIQ